ncbi:16S rRNA (guanine(966)-N(2))-methyltransferase RsmD [bacterium]|nr:16S rRNA (guanine(966)-N(2))-methyltransferase RsmD [bacterium]
MNITGGIYNGRKIKAPDERIVRPTLSKVRMSVFNVLYSIFGGFENKSFLDMFGGSGIMGLEALSRGFVKVAVFEKNRMVADIIKENYQTLNISPNLYIGDSIKLFEKTEDSFDVIYIDPPYMSNIYENILKLITDKNIEKTTVIVLEHVNEIDFNGFEIIKQKKYGDKYITFLSKIS